MRSWVVTRVLALFVLFLPAASCKDRDWQGRCRGLGDCDLDEHAAPICDLAENECIAGPPAGFTGPSWFWRGPTKDAPICPDVAPYGGIDIFDEVTPAVEPPCAEAASIHWGFIARECRITTESTCPGGADVRAGAARRLHALHLPG